MAASATARARATACSSPIRRATAGPSSASSTSPATSSSSATTVSPAWKWDPKADPHIVDVNNASDGDILIAYALGLAGKAWGEPRYTEAATKMPLRSEPISSSRRMAASCSSPASSASRRPTDLTARSWSTRPPGSSRRSRCSRSWPRNSPGTSLPPPAPRSSRLRPVRIGEASVRLGVDHRQGPRTGGEFPRGLRLQRHSYPALSDPRRARWRLPRSLRRRRAARRAGGGRADHRQPMATG